jgi:hypothetical protein
VVELKGIIYYNNRSSENESFVCDASVHSHTDYTSYDTIVARRVGVPYVPQIHKWIRMRTIASRRLHQLTEAASDLCLNPHTPHQSCIRSYSSSSALMSSFWAFTLFTKVVFALSSAYFIFAS